MTAHLRAARHLTGRARRLQGGWGGPPPPGGWNRRWDGPPRDVVVAQVDFGPFAYNSYMVIPTFNWMFGGWGYWYFGVWVPLY